MNRIRKKLHLYNLKNEGIKWVKLNLGEEYVDDFVEKYEKINRGIPIGGMYETMLFIDMIERIKKEIQEVDNADSD